MPENAFIGVIRHVQSGHSEGGAAKERARLWMHCVARIARFVNKDVIVFGHKMQILSQVARPLKCYDSTRVPFCARNTHGLLEIAFGRLTLCGVLGIIAWRGC